MQGKTDGCAAVFSVCAAAGGNVKAPDGFLRRPTLREKKRGDMEIETYQI